MNGIQISREAVDASAQAMAGKLVWDRMTPLLRHRYREQARVALNAAAPLLVAAAFDGVKAEVENLAAQRDAIGDDDYEPDEDDGDCCADAGECHRSGAMASYARVNSLLERKTTELRAQS